MNSALMEYAHITYRMMQGDVPSVAEVAAILPFWGQFTLHAWEQPDQIQQESLDMFTHAFQELDRFVGIRLAWADRFDEQGYPDSEASACGFVRHFVSAFHHNPCLPRPIICARNSYVRNTVSDFAVEHPVAIEYYAFYFTVDGHALLTTEDSSSMISPNSFVLVPPSCECRLERYPEEEVWASYWCYFKCRPEWIELVDWALRFSVPYVIEIEPLLSEVLQSSLTEMISILALPNELEERLITNLLESVLIRIKNVAPVVDDTGDRRVTRVANYLLHHIDETIPLTDLAAMVGISVSHLSSLFRTQMDMSLVSWRDTIRMEKACDLLQYSDLTITDIASRVGYPDQLYFTRRFRRFYGSSPSSYRKARRPPVLFHSTGVE